MGWCGNNDGDGEDREKEDMMIAVGALSFLSFSLSVALKERKEKKIQGFLCCPLSLSHLTKERERKRGIMKPKTPWNNIAIKF